MSQTVTGFAGATIGPWAWTITPDDGLSEIDLEACSFIFRVSSGETGLLDLTDADGFTVAGGVVTLEKLSKENTAALGKGSFGWMLIILPPGGDERVPGVDGFGLLTLKALPGAPTP